MITCLDCTETAGSPDLAREQGWGWAYGYRELSADGTIWFCPDDLEIRQDDDDEENW